ncbi:MAG: DegT/DnrJ/EryC1/StrS family aminotransferase [Leptonema sp. (in: bacteria)]
MLQSKKIVGFSKPDITDKEIQSVVRVLKSNWLTMGEVTESFERAIQKYLQVSYGIVLNSATAGLHLGLRAFDVKWGESVIVPDFTFTATAEVVFRCNAIPLLVDIDRTDYLISEEKIREFIKKYCIWKNKKLIHKPTQTHIRGILCVHYGGRVCDLYKLKELAKEYQLFLGEDAAHAFGSEYDNKKIGGFSDFTVFSFYATKNLTTGEGGVLTTNSELIAKRVQRMRLHGLSSETYKRKSATYDVVTEGYKYNISDILSAIGIVQLERYNEILEKRKRIHQIYQQEFSKFEKLKLCPEYSGSSYHLYTIEIDQRNHFAEELKKLGVSTSIHFKPLHLMTYYKKKKIYNPEDYPSSMKIYKRILSLPIYSSMSEEEIHHVVSGVKLVYENLLIKKNSKKIVPLFPLHK